MNAIHARPTPGAITEFLEAAQLPTADLTADHCEHFFYDGPESGPTGLVGLELLGDVALLRSLTVIPQARASALGSTP